MGSRATKFISRAPRYTLRASDNRFLRFARQGDASQSYTTHFIDISATGLAFVTDRDVSPQVSDLIKIEFPLENGKTVAWWARVVRVEEYDSQKWYMKDEKFQDSNQVLVAVSFHELPSGHAQAIREALNKKFEEVHLTEKRKKIKNMSLYIFENFWRILFYAICVMATVWVLKQLAQPDLIYTEEKGSPWGQRFPQFQWNDDAK